MVTLVVINYSVNEVRTGARAVKAPAPVPEFSFRKIERYMLYFLKHIVQGMVLFVVKYWFIGVTKMKKFLMDKWPKVHAIMKKKADKPITRTSAFIKRTIVESKMKIKHIKEHVRKEHDM